MFNNNFKKYHKIFKVLKLERIEEHVIHESPEN